MSFPRSTKAAVTLRSFTATYSDGKVFFAWETASEQDSAGFMLNRSTSENGTYNRIPSADPLYFGALGEGGDYSAEYYNDEGDLVTYYDEDVTEGSTYWYRLEMIDNNNISEYSDPVSVYIGATPTPTFTSTSSYQTSDATNTPTSTQSNGATTTKTPTSKPTKTKKPGTATPTFTATRYTNTGSGATSGTQAVNNNPTPDFAAETAAAQTAETGQPAATEAVISTTTLVPLPSITIVFPTAKVKQADVADASLAGGAKTAKTNSESWLTPQRMVIVAIIAGIWIMLGGWFYLSFKRLEK